MKKTYFILFFLIIVSTACKKEQNVSTVENFEGFTIPANFPTTHYDMNSNPISKEGFELGKKLFYDGILSRDGSTSCASCHQQVAAFAHLDHMVSHGIDDRSGTRNAPVIQNMAWNKFFFWDGGVFHLDDFSINPITNPLEMDETMPNVMSKLNADANYRSLFKKAFNKDSIDYASFTKALSQFMNMLVTGQSRYDKYIAGDINALSTNEIAGMNIFMTNCNSCHTAPLFMDNKFHNNGLSQLSDKGRSVITLQDSDQYKFKTPSLRNIEKSFPYMHNGRVLTLEAVINHYSSDIPSSPTLDPSLEGGISLSATEKTQLLAFLKSLTDDSFLKDKRFAE